MNNLKEFDVIFYMTNGDVFKMLYKSEIMKEVIDFFSEMLGRSKYISNSDENAFINTENINYFEIKEKTSSDKKEVAE